MMESIELDMCAMFFNALSDDGCGGGKSLSRGTEGMKKIKVELF